MVLRILTGHLFVIHICTAWVWMILFEYLKSLKPSVLGESQWEMSIFLPMAWIYVMVGVALIGTTIFYRGGK